MFFNAKRSDLRIFDRLLTDVCIDTSELLFISNACVGVLSAIVGFPQTNSNGYLVRSCKNLARSCKMMRNLARFLQESCKILQDNRPILTGVALQRRENSKHKVFLDKPLINCRALANSL